MGIELVWKAFDTFKDLLMEKKHFDIRNDNHYWKPGVYLHTIKVHQRELSSAMCTAQSNTIEPNKDKYVELVDYVGRVRQPRIIERQIEHFRNLRGGIYGCASEVLAMYDKDKYYEKNFGSKDFYNGLSGSKKKGFEDPKESRYFKIQFSKDDSMQLAKIFFDYAMSTKVYLAIAAVKEIDSIEKTLIEELTPIRNWNRNKSKNKQILQHTGDLKTEDYDKLKQNNCNFWADRENKGKEGVGLRPY